MSSQVQKTLEQLRSQQAKLKGERDKYLIDRICGVLDSLMSSRGTPLISECFYTIKSQSKKSISEEKIVSTFRRKWAKKKVFYTILRIMQENRMEMMAGMREEKANIEAGENGLADDMREYNLKERGLRGLKMYREMVVEDRRQRMVEGKGEADRVGRFKEVMREKRDKEKEREEEEWREEWRKKREAEEREAREEVRRKTREMYEREVGDEGTDLEESLGKVVVPDTSIPVPMSIGGEIKKEGCMEEVERSVEDDAPLNLTKKINDNSSTINDKKREAGSKKISRGSLSDFRAEIDRKRVERENRLKEVKKQEAIRKEEKRKAEEMARQAILEEEKRREKEEQAMRIKKRETEAREKKEKEKREREQLEKEKSKNELAEKFKKKKPLERAFRALFIERAGESLKLERARSHYWRYTCTKLIDAIMEEMRERFKDKKRKLIEKEFAAEAHYKKRTKNRVMRGFVSNVREAEQNEEEIFEMIDKRRLAFFFLNWKKVKPRLHESNYYYEKSNKSKIRGFRLKSLGSKVILGWAEVCKALKKERIVVKGKEQYMDKVSTWLHEYELKKKYPGAGATTMTEKSGGLLGKEKEI